MFVLIVISSAATLARSTVKIQDLKSEIEQLTVIEKALELAILIGKVEMKRQETKLRLKDPSFDSNDYTDTLTKFEPFPDELERVRTELADTKEELAKTERLEKWIVQLSNGEAEK